MKNNNILLKPYWYLVLAYLSFYIGLFTFYDKNYEASIFLAVIFGYSWRAFSYKPITIKNIDNEKCIVLNTAEGGTCLECPNCGEFYTLWHRHGKYCSGCGQRIIPPENWNKYI